MILGKEMDGQVRAYISEMRPNGCPINTAIVIDTGQDIVKDYNSNLLSENGGHLSLAKDWAKNLLKRMNYVKRRSSSIAKVSLDNFDQLKSQFIFDIQSIVEMEEILSNMVINWDQTAIKYVPVSNWTMADEGSQRVEVIAANDKRQITTVFGITLAGDFLPPQLIYQGTTPKCLPSIRFSAGWGVTFSENHWSNESTMEDYLNNIPLYYKHESQEPTRCNTPSLSNI